MIEILLPGPHTTVQDLGRPGLAALGVGHSGAADPGALRLANRLVGNVESAACLELTFGGIRLRSTSAGTLALAGAPCPVRVGGRDAAVHTPISVAVGEQMQVGRPTAGLRTYLAVRGGIDVPAVLGSRSTDVLAGLGPPILRAGAVLPVGTDVAGLPDVDVAPVPSYPDQFVLRVHPGPREDWFARGTLSVLCAESWLVTPESNRVGMRLAGPELERAEDRELPSEGMVLGALQVPPNGQPVLFLADHPVTGGYPVLAVVAEADVWLAAQARPGQRIRFRRSG